MLTDNVFFFRTDDLLSRFRLTTCFLDSDWQSTFSFLIRTGEVYFRFGLTTCSFFIRTDDVFQIRTDDVSNWRRFRLNMCTLQRNHLQLYTQMIKCQKVGGVWTWLWYQRKAESVLLTMITRILRFSAYALAIFTEYTGWAPLGKCQEVPWRLD